MRKCRESFKLLRGIVEVLIVQKDQDLVRLLEYCLSVCPLAAPHV